jgi:hypothetical protein
VAGGFLCVPVLSGTRANAPGDVRRRYLSLCNILPTLVQTKVVSMVDAFAQVAFHL